MGHNWAVLFGKKRVQRITVGVIVGLVVLSLSLTLVGGALAAPGPVPRAMSGVASVEASSQTITSIAECDWAHTDARASPRKRSAL